MLPKAHAFFGILYVFVISCLYPDIPVSYLIVVFMGAVFIDVDHYMYYVFKTGNLNLRNAFYYFYEGKEGERTPFFAVFHSVEFLLIFGIFSLTNMFLFSIFMGFMLHILLDWVNNIYYNAFKLRYYSLLLHGYRVAKMKND